MTVNDARATINLPRALHTEIREWAVYATRELERPVSFQEAARAILAAGVHDPGAGDAALDQLRSARQLWDSQQEVSR